jgi:hypothetical protein
MTFRKGLLKSIRQLYATSSVDVPDMVPVIVLRTLRIKRGCVQYM